MMVMALAQPARARGGCYSNHIEHVFSTDTIEQPHIILPAGEMVTSNATFFDRTVPASDIIR